MDQSVNEIVEYVSSLEASDTPHIQGLKAAMEELETGRETLGVILNEKLDEILKETMQVREDMDVWREKGSETEREKVRVEAEVEEMQQKKMLSEEEKRRCLERLEKATSTLQGFKNEDLKVAELAADNPRLLHAKKLLYTVSRLTLDSKAKQGQVKGFVVNPRKDDVKVFDFSENDEQVSPFFITNYIWGLIAAGTDPSWSKLAV